jgi:hypothetical protein
MPLNCLMRAVPLNRSAVSMRAFGCAVDGGRDVDGVVLSHAVEIAGGAAALT